MFHPLSLKSNAPSVLFAAFLAVVSAAHATQLTWNDAGPSNVWSTTDANWLVSSPWIDGNMALFNGGGETIEIDGTVVASGTVSNPAGLTLLGGYTIADADANGTFRLQGAGGGGGTSKPIISHVGSNTISANVILSGSTNNNGRTVTGTAGAALVISGNISESEGAKVISFSGANSSVTLSGSNSFSGGVAFGNSNVTLNVNNANALGTGTVTIGSSVTPITLGNTSGSNIALATNNALTLSTTSPGSISTNNLVYNSPNDLDFGDGAITFAGDPGEARSISVSGVGTLILSGDISEASPGKALIKNGVGTLQLDGIGAYTGNTTVNGGTLSLTSTSESRFVLQDIPATSTMFLGSGTAVFDGTFRLDISNVTVSTGTWTLVNVGTLNETFGANFGLGFVSGPDFVDNLDGTYSSGNWTFAEATGTLTLVPEPSTSVLIGIGLSLVLTRLRRAAYLSGKS